MKYEEFTKKRFNDACEKEWFDKDGNNVTATCNRGFFGEIKSQFKGFNRDLLCVVEWDVLFIQVLNLIILVLSPILYVPFLLLRVASSRKAAKKEMMKIYSEYLNK